MLLSSHILTALTGKKCVSFLPGDGWNALEIAGMLVAQPDFLERFFPSVLADVLADGQSGCSL
jgi:hypothetical protein